MTGFADQPHHVLEIAMRNRYLISALAASILASGAAYAHGDQDSATTFKQLDSNSDGQLSSAELAKLPALMHQHLFARIDSNGDGRIDNSEFKAQAEQRAARRFKHMDANHDGAIEPDEMKRPQHGPRAHHHDKCARAGSDHSWHQRHSPDVMLKKMDTDGNGSISLSEWQAASAQWRAHHTHMKSGHQDSNDS